MDSQLALDVIIRFHDRSRLYELERCFFSLACQSYAPVCATVVTQRFTPEQIRQLQASIDLLAPLNTSLSLRVLNYAAGEPTDARSAMLNTGIEAATGRYLAFLDYDDVIYKDAYAQLIERVQGTGSTIAFGGIAVKTVEIFDDAAIVKFRKNAYAGKQKLIDMFAANHCPIHSFVIDKTTVKADDLQFKADLVRCEDYDFLLRLCTKYPSNFDLKSTIVGDYYLKDDGSNTMVASDAEQLAVWVAAEGHMSRLRNETRITPEVQLALGIPHPYADFTVRQALTRQQRLRSKKAEARAAKKRASKRTEPRQARRSS